MEKVRYGIIGIGKMGGIHAYRINKGLDRNAILTAVCDTNIDRRNWAKEKFKSIAIYEDYKELLKDANVDAVIIATPHYFHPSIAIDSFVAGKHVLSEKPAGVFTKAVREENEVAKMHGNLVYGIMYNQRTNPLYKEAKRIIDNGELGELKRINWIITDWYRPQAYYNQGGWRGTWEGEGGGVLINQCPHQIDLLQWLAGMPVKIRGYAEVGKNRKINVENDVTAYMEFANGATGVFITSTHDFPGTNRLEIDGDGGKIVIEGSKLIFNKLDIFEGEFNKKNEKFMPIIPSKKIKIKYGKIREMKDLLFVGQHMGIIKNFSKSILNKEKLIAPGEEGINGLTISNAIHLSSWLDKEVTLPIDENLFIAELEKRKELENKNIKN